MIKFKSYSGRLCVRLVYANVLGIILSYFVWSKLMQHVLHQKSWWWNNYYHVVILECIFMFLICLLITYITHRKVYYLDSNKKIIMRGNKTFHYNGTQIKIIRTLGNKFFGTVTIVLKGMNGKMVLRNIPESIVKHLTGK